MTKQRIDFLSVDAARFNALRDQWRDVASGCVLPVVAHKLASLLPAYVSREYGYAFPTDEQLAETIKATPRTVGRGMNALDTADLIERKTVVKRDDKGEAVGRLRRIYLTLPDQVGERTTSERTGVNGQGEVNGQDQVGERTTVVRIYPDRITPDNSNGSGARKHSAMPAREGCPVGYTDDFDFLDAFDQIVVEMTDGREIGAGEISTIVQEAFDRTTGSSPLFMPFFWSDVCKLRKNDTEEWFRRRAGQLVHRRAAA
jgi:hypothetical protein